jgi:RNA polymerase sigma-32 factor
MVDHLGSERSLDRYVSEINKYPLLTREEEILLAKCYCESGSQDAAHKLMVANLRFVVKTAHQYRGYGLKILDLVQEGNMGLMIAVKKFDPSRGYRLVSYAVWWIRAYIQSFIMRAWSQVKVGTTQAQRKLFFRVRSERQRADRAAGPGEHATPQQIGARLNVSALEVANMEARLGERDFSLDAQVVEGGRSCHVDMLASSGDSQEELYAGAELRQLLRCKVNETMESLNPKERYVITHRAGDRQKVAHLPRTCAADRGQCDPQDRPRHATTRSGSARLCRSTEPYHCFQLRHCSSCAVA